MDRRRLLGGIGLLALAAAGTGAHAFSLPPSPVFGRSFEDMRGARVSLSRYIGRPVLMNFWASWCAPCVREMPLLESLHHAHPELSVVGLAIDTAANVQRFIQKVPVSYELLLGGPDGISIMRELGNKGGGLPFTAFFDKRGRSQGVVLGELTDGVLATRLGQIL
jgi:thiol-disulfide isomerase/thioredoxin